jgi:hypothetical protein
MDKEKEKQLTKYVESMCEDCELWIKIENCRECLFNVFQEMDKLPPFWWDDKKKSDKKH